MHAYLIIGNKGKNNTIKKLAGNGKKDLIRFELQKIDDVRQLKSLTKYHGSERKTYLLPNFERATTEAMNAFLKLLEEPNENINFILCAESDENILETVFSRCRIIRVGHKINEDKVRFAEKFLNSKISEKLKTLHSISKKEEAINFLSDIVCGTHPLIIREKNNSLFLANVTDIFISTKKKIGNNANVTIALTKLTLDLVRTTQKNYNE